MHPFAFTGQEEAPFWTNTFIKEDATGRQLVRVFWSWYNPQEPGPVHWQAPKNSRWYFGNTRALFKMYFTSVMRDPKETTEDSAVRAIRSRIPARRRRGADTGLQRVDGNAEIGRRGCHGNQGSGAGPD